MMAHPDDGGDSRLHAGHAAQAEPASAVAILDHMRGCLGPLLVGLLLVASPVTGQNEQVQVGQPFPTLRGDLLTGATVDLPAAASGKVTLLLLGFTYGSRSEVEAWSVRFREAFAREPRVTFFEVPMLGGMARVGRWFIDSGMRRGTPQAFHGNVLTVYQDVGDWKRRIGYHEKMESAAYLVLLGADGTVRWLHAGPVDDASFASLNAAVVGLLVASPPR